MQIFSKTHSIIIGVQCTHRGTVTESLFSSSSSHVWVATISIWLYFIYTHMKLFAYNFITIFGWCVIGSRLVLKWKHKTESCGNSYARIVLFISRILYCTTSRMSCSPLKWRFKMICEKRPHCSKFESFWKCVQSVIRKDACVCASLKRISSVSVLFRFC